MDEQKQKNRQESYLGQTETEILTDRERKTETKMHRRTERDRKTEAKRQTRTDRDANTETKDGPGPVMVSDTLCPAVHILGT